MPIEHRLLRDLVDHASKPRIHRTAREQACEDRILHLGQVLLARFGRAHITFSGFAAALQISPATLRRYFPDLDTLLAEILFRHLREVSTALGAVPFGSPGAEAARRAAYVAATRNGFGGPSERHLLLLRDRTLLPPDLLAPIEQIREQIGVLLGGAEGYTALVVCDMPDIRLEIIESMLAAIAPPVQPTQNEPPPPSTQCRERTRSPRSRTIH